ncbi:hypothetical protein ACHAQF_005956 [Verticillium nonalfalfae]
MKHMQKVHGLFIPDKKRLIVDLETLFSYLHLIIVRHNECICCGTQRASTLAVQQHMLGKGHCKFDIASDDSEFADFYDFSGSEAGSGVDEDADDISRFGKDALTQTRADKKEYKFAKQLASLNKNDERSLAHLSLPQQRAILATHQKQIEMAHRAEERYRGRLESLGNQFLMTHFVKDAADKRTLWK